MRSDGRKLTKDELSQAQPVRGVLALTTHYSRDSQHTGVTYATLTNSKLSEPLLTALRHAHVAAMKDSQFVIHGEETDVPKVGSSISFPQAWWCKVVDQASHNAETR